MTCGPSAPTRWPVRAVAFPGALIAVGGGGAWFWLRSQGAGPAGAAPRAVLEVAGNLLAEGASFEEAAPDGRVFEAGWQERWSTPESAPASF